MADELVINHTNRGAADVLEVRGDLDVYTASRLRQAVLDLAGRGRCRLVVDLEHAGFVDHTGLGVIVGALRRCRENDGKFALAGTGEPILRLLRITGLAKVLDACGTVDEALELVDGEIENGPAGREAEPLAMPEPPYASWIAPPPLPATEK